MLKKMIGAFIFIFLGIAEVQAVNVTDAVISGGEERPFIVHIPDNIVSADNVPVLIAMHGGGGNAGQFQRQSGLDRVADKEGFIVVYPEGNKSLLGNFRTWNAGPCCGSAARQNKDDVAFISAMIEALVEKYRIDRRRVYATGHSNGAMMSYRLACELSDKIAAIAPNGGQRPFRECRPQRPVPVLHIHGTADPCALYDGGTQCGGCFSEMLGMSLAGDKWACSPVKGVVRDHAHINGCGGETEIIFTKGAVVCERYKGCGQDATVALCSIRGGGHRWPGNSDMGPPVCQKNPDQQRCRKYLDTVGPKNTDIDAGELMWSFLKMFHAP